jgi:hypothetical protein
MSKFYIADDEADAATFRSRTGIFWRRWDDKWSMEDI